MVIDKDTYRKLLKAYNKAVQGEKESFEFDKVEMLVSYAKYMIEYMEQQLNIKKKKDDRRN